MLGVNPKRRFAAPKPYSLMTYGVFRLPGENPNLHQPGVVQMPGVNPKRRSAAQKPYSLMSLVYFESLV